MAKSSTFIVKLEHVPIGATSTTAPTDGGRPGGNAIDTPPAVIVATIRIGRALLYVMPVSGSVQLVMPSHCVNEAMANVYDIECSVASRPACGNALDDMPQ